MIPGDSGDTDSGDTILNSARRIVNMVQKGEREARLNP